MVWVSVYAVFSLLGVLDVGLCGVVSACVFGLRWFGWVCGSAVVFSQRLGSCLLLFAEGGFLRLGKLRVCLWVLVGQWSQE